MKKYFFLLVVLGGLFITFRIYKIDGTSMNYGLVDGDIVISTHFYDTIERGDLLVIRHPLDPKQRLYIKRCAALPGDRYFEQGRMFYLQIEGNSKKTETLGRQYGLTLVKRPEGYFIKEPYAKYYGVVHDWGLRVPRVLTSLPLTTVAPQHYLVLGDFRDNSADSRFFGAVPKKWVMSKVIVIVKRPRSWRELLKIKEAD